MLKLFLVVFVALEVVGMLTDKAEAAEQDPRTVCNEKIRWSLSSNYTPDEAESVITWAYLQVAPETGTVAVPNGDEDIVWDWQHPMGGGVYLPGETYLDTSVFGNREFWVHAFDGEKDPTVTLLKEQVLRLVVEDFGVRASTSTAAGLSAADRAALKAICKAEAAPGTDPEGDTKGDEESDETADTDNVTDSNGDRAAATPPPGGKYGLLVLLLLLAPMFAYAFAGEKVLALVKRAKGNDCEDRTR